jgi:hypothetical protein
MKEPEMPRGAAARALDLDQERHPTVCSCTGDMGFGGGVAPSERSRDTVLRV